MDSSYLKMQSSMINSNIKQAASKDQPPTIAELRAQSVAENQAPEKEKNITERYKEQQEEAEKDKVTLSEERMKRLRGEKAKTEAEEKEEELPANIKTLKKQIRKLKEDLEEKLEQLEELKRQPGTTIETLEPHMQEVQMMQAMISTLKASLAEAMKKAGISDPSILNDL